MADTLVSANIKSNPLMSNRQVLEDVIEVKNMLGAGDGGVIFWQEMKPDNYKSAIRGQLPRTHWDNRHIGTETPQSFKSGFWNILHQGVITTHAGAGGVTPTRRIVWTVAQRQGSDMVVAFVNTHFVSGAWTSAYRYRKSWRRQAWNHHYTLLDEVVRRFYVLGFTIVFGGDWNRSNVTPFMARQRWLRKARIDYLGCIEHDNGPQITLHSSYSVNLHSDHHAEVAEVTFVRPAGYVRPDTVPNFSDLKWMDTHGRLRP